MGALLSQDPEIKKIAQIIDGFNAALRRNIEDSHHGGEEVEALRQIIIALESLIAGVPLHKRLASIEKAIASTKIARARNILAKLAPDELKNMSLAEIIALGKGEDKSLPVDPFYGIRMLPKQTTKSVELVSYDKFYRRDMRVVLKATEYTEYDPFFKRQMKPRKG